MSDELYQWGLIGIFGMAAIILPFLFFVSAPYGRHSRPGWGPVLPARLGWILMELPSPLCFAWMYFQGAHATNAAPLVLFSLYMAHYVYRAIVYPFQMRGSNKTKPLLTVVMAFIFNIANGSLNGWAIAAFGDHLDSAWLSDPRFLIGVVLFVTGAAINLRSDAILRALRKDGDSGYSIPNQGLHRQVASPNYFGEIIEWTGFAIAAWTMPALAFLFFTIANLAPRARDHLRWYRQTFPSYPTERRALIPGIW
jgi:3-oxo-5-alpha-steroid 4-dehydrogenase 1